MSSRLAYGMARDGLLPGALARVLPGRRTPWVAALATTALSLLLALTGEVEALAETLVLLLVIVFAVVNASVIALRRDHEGGRTDHFRVPLVVPWLGIASCLLLLTRIEGAVWVRGAVLLAVGGVFACVTAWRARGAAARRPDGESAAGNRGASGAAPPIG
jgi:basic amino acid/polyamine antiporter, APA family